MLGNVCNIEIEKMKRELKSISNESLRWKRKVQEDIKNIYHHTINDFVGLFDEPKYDKKYAITDKEILEELSKHVCFCNEIIGFLDKELMHRKEGNLHHDF